MMDQKHPEGTAAKIPPPAFSEIQPGPQQSSPSQVSEKPPFVGSQAPLPAGPQVPLPAGPNSYVHSTPLSALTRSPAPVDCPACGSRGLTVVGYESGNTTHLAALALCFVACLGCIPYLFSGLKDVTHRCANCGTMLAIWHRSGTPGSAEVLVHAQVPGSGLARKN